MRQQRGAGRRCGAEALVDHAAHPGPHQRAVEALRRAEHEVDRQELAQARQIAAVLRLIDVALGLGEQGRQ